ncbi:hypothetical protein ATL17_0233 [Maritalea mobilis]|uniref:Uncharacterized protein n=1 Tax=Maritalea mobilis TaxID=483324 RepID=A0A4R6VQJ3_9HYPH|nr:hypothetical protein [Maritalea mobilis]TDQ66242.1 hypothetical protein ATL17_0233 [Maritalea mobilis]
MHRTLMTSIKDLFHIRQTLLELDCSVTKENDHLGLFKPEIQIDTGHKAKATTS